MSYKKDLLNKIEELEAEYTQLKPNEEVDLKITLRELKYIKVWIKTAYANEDALDEVLKLK